MSAPHPRTDGPRRRRVTPEQKFAHLATYEQACEDQQSGAYLRREGLHSSLITEWRRLPDAGVLEGKQPGQTVGRPAVQEADRDRSVAPRAGDHPPAAGSDRDGAGDHGKSTRALGGDLQERGYRVQAQQALMGAYTALTAHGASTREASARTGVPRSTATRRQQRPAPPAPREVEPANRLSCAERAAVLAVLNSDEFVDNAQVKARHRQAHHPARGVYYDAYVMIDIYSRYLVGVHLHGHESGPLAEEMMREVFEIHGIPQVVHADRSTSMTSMTSKTVATPLTDLEVTRSHSRPKVSNDNPYSEATFKTLKYHPTFPERFGSLAHAREFMDEFKDRYNHEHHHSGLDLHTPADVHYGLATAKADDRAKVLTEARAAHPEGDTMPITEGQIFADNGDLNFVSVWVDSRGNKVFRAELASKEVELIYQDEESTLASMAFGVDGSIYLADLGLETKSGRILKMDRDGTNVRQVAANYEGDPTFPD